MNTTTVHGHYKLEFSDGEWEELTAMCFEQFHFSQDDALTRAEWTALAHMALGKAQLIDEGRYNWSDEGPDEDDMVSWSEELRAIASKILDYFQPADGKI